VRQSVCHTLTAKNAVVRLPIGSTGRVGRLALLEGLAPWLQFFGLFHQQVGDSRFGYETIQYL
jgi:hypothetical protein